MTTTGKTLTMFSHNEVIHRDLSSWVELILVDSSLCCRIGHFSLGTWITLVALTVLAGSTERNFLDA
jgi:hypothetical protein